MDFGKPLRKKSLEKSMRSFTVQNFTRSNSRLISYLAETILSHTLTNALSVEELNMLGFNDGSCSVCFVYYFFRLQLI